MSHQSIFRVVLEDRTWPSGFHCTVSQYSITVQRTSSSHQNQALSIGCVASWGPHWDVVVPADHVSELRSRWGTENCIELQQALGCPGCGQLPWPGQVYRRPLIPVVKRAARINWSILPLSIWVSGSPGQRSQFCPLCLVMNGSQAAVKHVGPVGRGRGRGRHYLWEALLFCFLPAVSLSDCISFVSLTQNVAIVFHSCDLPCRLLSRWAFVCIGSWAPKGEFVLQWMIFRIRF